MSSVEEARVRWIKERPLYEAFCSFLRQRLQTHLRPLGIWFEVTVRSKEVDSLVKKLLRKPAHTFETLPDKVGARIIIRYRADIQRVIGAVSAHFDRRIQDDKIKELGTERVGYQSVHLDGVRLFATDQNAVDYHPDVFWAEVQVRTLAQHLWAEMSHDSVYKNDEMISVLEDDVKRRVNLMSGQIEVADREFDRLNSELASSEAAARLLRTLEKHYYTLSSRRPDTELSMQVLNAFLPLVQGNLQVFMEQLNDFLSSKHKVLKVVYDQASEAGIADTTSFLFQPEALILYDLLSSDMNSTRKLWTENYPAVELERIANAFGISLD